MCRGNLKIVFDDKMESRVTSIWEVTLETIQNYSTPRMDRRKNAFYAAVAADSLALGVHVLACYRHHGTTAAPPPICNCLAGRDTSAFVHGWLLVVCGLLPLRVTP